MEFTTEKVQEINKILTTYINKQISLLNDERDTSSLVCNKGTDPIIYDIYTDSLQNNIFVANKINSIVSSLERKDEDDYVKGNKSSFAELAGGFDGKINNDTKLNFMEIWNDACEFNKQELISKLKVVKSVVANSGLTGIKKQEKEITLNYSKALEDLQDTKEIVFNFIRDDNPTKKIKV